jgi:hypothetical protein
MFHNASLLAIVTHLRHIEEGAAGLPAAPMGGAVAAVDRRGLAFHESEVRGERCSRGGRTAGRAARRFS